MNEPFRVDLFVEDQGHAKLLDSLIRRVAGEESIRIEVNVRSARGGHGRAIREFELYQALVEKGLPQGSPDLVVVAIDGNCSTAARKRAEIEKATRPTFSARVVAACPDPHVEKWYLADADCVAAVVGHRPVVGRKKCVRDYYKRLLADAVRRGGHPATLGGIEFAQELAAGMDLYRAGRADRSLRAFLEDLRSELKLAQTHPGVPSPAQ